MGREEVRRAQLKRRNRLNGKRVPQAQLALGSMARDVDSRGRAPDNEG